jgi:two-component system, NtrC family, C4-dicarboxylate transport response regulator DctD
MAPLVKRILVVDDDPAVCQLDVTMPGADGVTVLKEIRMIDRTIPVIMVTGADDPGIMADALNNGAIAYIGKPFDLRYVENLVALALQPRPVVR